VFFYDEKAEIGMNADEDKTGKTKKDIKAGVDRDLSMPRER
jgi:hypothetical protein